jgi:hypothetical protein
MTMEEVRLDVAPGFTGATSATTFKITPDNCGACAGREQAKRQTEWRVAREREEATHRRKRCKVAMIRNHF